MSTGHTYSMTVAEYDRAADAYQATLPLEHYMEGEVQATQREIALASLAQLRVTRPDVRYFSELLVQYFYKGKLRQVVPDNMAVVPGRQLATKKSYALEYETPPTLVLEWVSDNSKGKDYVDSFKKYEKELKVPYALFFHPDRQDFRIYRHNGKKYEPVPVNEAGRHPLPELELEVGLLGGWVRFWHRGELLELPDALLRANDELRKSVAAAKRQARAEKKRAEQAERERDELMAELARLRAAQSQQPPATP